MLVPEGTIWLRRASVLETLPCKEVTCWIPMRPARCDAKTLTLTRKTLNKPYQNLNPKQYLNPEQKNPKQVLDKPQP